jgi:hypothetical protein
MPVELPVAKSRSGVPKPPRAIVWLALFVICMLAGVVGTLLTWPKTEPTGSPWFWMRLLVFPALAWCLGFGLRSHYYQEEMERLLAEDDTLEMDRVTALRFATEPLAVLGGAYLCALGSAAAAGKIAQGSSALIAMTPHSGGKAIRHTALTVAEDPKVPGRYRACFLALLDLIAVEVATIPNAVPLAVRVQLPRDAADQELVLETWQTCWLERKLRRVQATLLPAQKGVMALDEWLDIRGGPALEKFTLFVSVQLHDKPAENSAEAAVALLLGWAPLAERHGVKALATLHRPIEAGLGTLIDSIHTGLLWGGVIASKVDDLWQAALEAPDKPDLINSASDISLGVSKTHRLSGIHDVDIALGHAGAAAGWLAVSLAIEHASHTGKPQLIAWREGSLRFAVVQAAVQDATAPNNENETEATA